MGHIIGMTSELPAHYAVDWTPADDRRRKGRVNKKTWWATHREDVQARTVSCWSEVEVITAHRVHW